MSIKAIAARLGVSPSTVSLWTRDIVLTSDQHEALRNANPIYNQQLRGQEQRRRSAAEDRIRAQETGRRMARANRGLHRSGCVLYWAEGSKTRNTIRFTNSDADMVAYFLRFLRECYEIDDSRISLTVNCFLNNGLSLDEIEGWWVERLGLPMSCLRKATVSRASRLSRFRRNTLPYGTARISVYSTFVVQSIYGAIQEYVGMSRPGWLDCGPTKVGDAGLA